jgi:hypothetical protein
MDNQAIIFIIAIYINDLQCQISIDAPVFEKLAEMVWHVFDCQNAGMHF